MPRRKPIDHDFTPVICPGCGDPIVARVQFTARVPLGWKNLSKDGIRSKHVKVESADWDLAQFFCGCPIPSFASKPVGRPPKDPDKIEAREALVEKKRRCGARPGRRWTKNFVPKPKPLVSTKDHPLCKKPKS